MWKTVGNLILQSVMCANHIRKRANSSMSIFTANLALQRTNIITSMYLDHESFKKLIWFVEDGRKSLFQSVICTYHSRKYAKSSIVFITEILALQVTNISTTMHLDLESLSIHQFCGRRARISLFKVVFVPTIFGRMKIYF